MLRVLNKEKQGIGLIDSNDIKISKEINTLDIITCSLKKSHELANKIDEEFYFEDEDNIYIVKSKDIQKATVKFEAILNVDEIKGKAVINGLSTKATDVIGTLRLAIAGTGWTIEDAGAPIKKRSIDIKNTSNAWAAVEQIIKKWKCEYRIDSKNKKIIIKDSFTQNKGVYFSNELNALSIGRRSETSNLITRLIPIGKDGLKINDINSGKSYVENFQYTDKVIEQVWEDNRYTVAEDLKEDAILKLDELSKPNASYTLTIKDLASINPDEYSFLSYELGDIITIIDTQTNFKDEQRIVKMDIYKYTPNKNSVTIANKFKSFTDKQKEQEETTETVDLITNENGTIDGTKVENLKNNLEIHEIKVDILDAVKINVGELVANKANIDDLHATNAEIINLKANKADVTELTAVSGKINILESEVAKIGVLEGDVANVKDVIAGNISSDNIQSGGITGDRLNMNTIFINDANIVNVNANKVNAGEIDTSKVKVKSADGAIEIAGATQQFRDKNNKVRIQMGKDAKGDFNFIIKGEDGTTTLIDHNGVKESAIADDLIKDNMIAEDAVGEKQIDYSSFATGFNKDTNTTQIKATKVKLDNQGQTLDVAFTSLKNQADGTKTQTESNTTQINVQQGQISTAIANTKIVKDGKEILLKDDYNTTIATVDAMKNTISSHTTKIDANTGKIGTVESKTNVLERDLNSMSSKISATETTVNTHTTEISIANTNASNAQSTANTAVTKADKAQTDANKNKADIITVNTEVTTTKNKVSGIEQDLDSVTTRVGSVESTTTSHTATINNHTSSLNAVDGKINTAKNTAITDARKLIDTRDKNENPSWYFTNYPRQTITEFKHSDIVQIPGSRIYGTLETKVPWTDSSGGYPVQIFRSNGKPSYERKGTSNTVWTSWVQIEDVAGSQNKATQALNDGKNYTNLEVNKVITSTNSKFAEIKTTTDSITQSVSNTNREVETVKVHLTNKTSINEQTKVNGQELLPQNYKVNSGEGFDCVNNNKVIFNNNKITVKGNLWIKTVPTLIKFDRTKPLYWKVSATTTGAQFYVGVERYDKNKNVINNAENGACVYFVSGSTTLNGAVEGWWTETDKTTAYIQLRILCDWNNTGKDTIINEISWKQLSASSQLDTSKEILDITTEKVDQAKADIKITTDAISSKVSQVENTTNSINGKVTAHESRIASAEQKITPSAIINTVSQTIDNKVNVVNKKLGEMKLENDALNIKFEQRGGVNYLRCADGFKNNITADWHTRTFNNNLGAILSVINNNEWVYPDPNVATFQLSVLDNWSISSGEIATIQYDIKVQKGKEYTISFYTAGHRHSDCYSQIRGQENNGNAVIAAIGFSPQRGGSNLNNWSFVKYSFVAQTNFVHFEIGMRNRGDADPYLWFSKPVLNDGALPIKFTTNDKELNSGITKINSDGVRCDFEDGSYASMGRNGLRYYKNGMSNPYQYITFNSRIAAIRNGHWRNVRLPDAFRGKQINHDFQLFVTLGNYNLNAYVSGSISGALRVAFAEWSGWDANNCTINIRPCFQKIGIDTKKLYGWDAGSTSEGAVANEGEGDVIIFAQM